MIKMGSPNGNPHPKHRRSMPRPFSCTVCGRKYAMEWAKVNHQKLCKEIK